MPGHGSAHARLPQLDGLRAIAILSVFVHHRTSLLPIGWAGVQLFFVLSGFLITGILWRARTDDHYWAPFYLKRATRILPPLLLFLTVCAFTVSISWKTTGLAYIFFGANIVQSLPHVPVTELTVLWSLAVEEHFYLLWPFAIRYLHRRSLILLLTAILVLEPIARALATHHVAGYTPIYQLTCFQLDGLAAGALLALLLDRPPTVAWLSRASGPLALASATLFAACSVRPTFTRDANSAFFNLLGYTLIIAAFAFSLAYVLIKSSSLPSRILSTRALVFLGTISYGVYLYSGPIAQAIQWAVPHTLHHKGLMNLVRVALEAALTLTLSWLSFRFYESPITRWGRRVAKTLPLRVPLPNPVILPR